MKRCYGNWPCTFPRLANPLCALDIHLSVLSSLPEEDWFSEKLQTLNEIFQAIMNAANKQNNKKNAEANMLLENEFAWE
jgi:hypothetical protein